jgi:hypothetical protein
VVAALTSALRGRLGRNPGDNDDTTGHLSGRSMRVLASGLAFQFAASRMTTREREAGKASKFRFRFPNNKRLTNVLPMVYWYLLWKPIFLTWWFRTC